MDYKISNRMRDMKPSAIREIFKSLGKPGAISFAAGNPSPLSFPVEAISALSADILANDSTTALQYGVTEGYLPLRGSVAARLKSKFAIDTDSNTTIITTGGQQALELACKALCNEGDVILCEEPTFIGALNAFRSIGAKPIGVPLENDGINIEVLEEKLKTTPNVKMIYVIPTFQNPAGLTTSAEKRKKIYELAKKYDVVILEDNPYGELRFSGEDILPIKSMDTNGRVIYCGSFSKVLSAGIRVGFAVGGEEIIQKMVVAKQVEDVHTNVFFQMLCHRFLTEYDFDAHIQSIRDLYRHKATLMIDALDRFMPKSVAFTRPEGGLFLWCTLPEGYSMSEYVKRAADNNVFVVPGVAFCCDTEGTSQSFRLNYSTPSDEDITKGIEILGSLV